MKTSIKIATFMFIVSLVTVPSFADDIKFGLGASATESSATVYIPIKVPVAKNFVLVEPTLSFTKDVEEQTGTVTTDTRNGNYGVGVFFGQPLTENIDLLIGGRVAYVKQTVTDEFTAHTTEVDTDGYTIAPTLGIEYNVNPHIAVGGFVDYSYTNLSGTGTDTATPGVESKTETESFRPNTNLFVKFYF